MYRTLLLPLLFVSAAVLAQKKIEYMYPTHEFDRKTISDLLDESGTGKIQGKALLKGKPVSYYMTVSLFPLTDYFAEYLNLEKQFGTKGNKRASISPAALSYRLITKVDAEDGTFEFVNLKPGKYYIEGHLAVPKEKKGSSYVGQDSFTFEGSLISGPPLFKTFTYTKVSGYYISGVTEILNEGDIADVTIKDH